MAVPSTIRTHVRGNNRRIEALLRGNSGRKVSAFLFPSSSPWVSCSSPVDTQVHTHEECVEGLVLDGMTEEMWAARCLLWGALSVLQSLGLGFAVVAILFLCFG